MSNEEWLSRVEKKKKLSSPDMQPSVNYLDRIIGFLI